MKWGTTGNVCTYVSRSDDVGATACGGFSFRCENAGSSGLCYLLCCFDDLSLFDEPTKKRCRQQKTHLPLFIMHSVGSLHLVEKYLTLLLKELGHPTLTREHSSSSRNG